MSKRTNRDTAPRHGGSVEDRLARLLDSPMLARVVPHLPPETLHQLIRSRGLDACGELVTLATASQLTSLLDLDLWRHALRGRDEQFDVDRFGEWLEVLVETGSSMAARTVARLDAELVVLGLSRYVRVFDLGIFEPTAQSDDEAPDREDAMREGDALDASSDEGGGLECEVAGYVVRARRADAWDAILALMTALEAEHADFFQAVMHGCRQLSNSRPEVDGLDDLLMAPEQQLHEVAVERERRRSQQGYATPADARAFLEMARRPRSNQSLSASITVNPIVAAYFRAADEALEPTPDASSTSTVVSLPAGDAPVSDTAHASDATQSLDAVIELLTEAGVMPARPRALLEASDADPASDTLADLRRLIADARDTDDAAYFARTRELAFLANTLVAGCTVQSRPFTPQEASDAAAAVCNLGLEHWPGAPPVERDLVTAFEVGWSVLHRDVSLFAARRLVAALADVESMDDDVRRELAALRRTLIEQCDAGTPWRARGAAEVLALIDPTVWIAVLGLLDECPVLPAALVANLERRTTTVSPTAFEFISTARQVEQVRAFVEKVPELLSR